MPVTSPEKLKVLVVDDDEMNRRMMRLILTREDHYVELACDGFEACEMVRDQQFDIILMDLQMPEMDGIETSRRIRASEVGEKYAYIVALTASYLPEKGRELFEAGIDNYISKPFDVEHLRHILDYGLDHRKTTRHEEESPKSGTIKGAQIFNRAMGLQQVGGDEDVFRELLADFVVELPQRIDHMEKNFDKLDMNGLSRVAHNLKGVSASLGAMQLSQYADTIENRAGEGYTESVIFDLKAIKTASETFIRHASDFLFGAGNN